MVASHQPDGLGVEAIACLLVLAIMLLYCLCLSDGKGKNRPWLGWLRSLMIFLAFLHHLVL